VKRDLAMTPQELELLQGMGNCYSVCGADYEGTVRMVGGARGLDPEQVKKILKHIKKSYKDDYDYKRLRKRIPKEFPI
jgi:hypothetical protein